MGKYDILFWIIAVGLVLFLLFMLYQGIKLTNGGPASSSEAIATLPLVVQANVSLIAFWGLIVVFRIRELSSTRIELMKNLWEIGFRRDDLRIDIEKAKGDKEKELLNKLYEELETDAKKTNRLIESFYSWETMMMYTGLLPAVFFVVSIISGIYGIGMTFHAELVDPITYFTPIVSLATGVLLTLLVIFSSTFRVVMRIR